MILALLRSLLYTAWMTVTVVPWACVVIVCSAFLRPTPLWWVTVVWLRGTILGARWICGVRYRIQGFEHLPTDPKAGAIICPKHQSTWETFAFPTLMPHPLAYVFKRELLYIPFFGWAMSRLDMIHIDRSKRNEAWTKVAQQGQRLMDAGNWVIMFPEGTRTPRGAKGVYKTGATRLAVATGMPLIPIAVTSARVWPRRSFLVRPGVIDISIGRPIVPDGRSPDELMAAVEDFIESEMRRLDPQAYVPGEPTPVERR